MLLTEIYSSLLRKTSIDGAITHLNSLTKVLQYIIS